jgi:hypothetical protein
MVHPPLTISPSPSPYINLMRYLLINISPLSSLLYRCTTPAHILNSFAPIYEHITFNYTSGKRIHMTTLSIMHALLMALVAINFYIKCKEDVNNNSILKTLPHLTNSPQSPPLDTYPHTKNSY